MNKGYSILFFLIQNYKKNQYQKGAYKKNINLQIKQSSVFTGVTSYVIFININYLSKKHI